MKTAILFIGTILCCSCERYGNAIQVASCSNPPSNVVDFTKPLPETTVASDLAVGQYGFVRHLTSVNGKLYITRSQSIYASGLKVQRIKGGFIADCSDLSSVTLFIDKDSGLMIPIVGTLH